MEKFLTYESFLKKVIELDMDYWKNTYEKRWQYIEPIINKLKTINPDTAIELGTMGISLMTFSDTIDLFERNLSNRHNKTYLFDATKTPWNIPDKKYDIFVGLQVLEHLGPNQSDVFKEIKRISREAIITLPFLWDCKDTTDCHYMIDDDKIAEFTNGEIPYNKEKILGNHDRYRIELHYIF